MNTFELFTSGGLNPAAGSLMEEFPGNRGTGFRVCERTDGRSRGVRVVTLVAGQTEVDILPDRGMGIHRALDRGTRYGWDSPVGGPVHPSLVPVGDPGGIGWLEGFDEMLARCGLLSNGAPEFDEDGRVRFPVHGRIANLPAGSVSVSVDDAAGSVEITGKVLETRFLIYSLQLETTIRLTPGKITVHDQITNVSARPGSFQILYHNNFGSPVLADGAKFTAPVQEIAPRDARAAEGISHWDEFSSPATGYAEQVYFMKLDRDESGMTRAMLENPETRAGVSIGFNANDLPCFSLWKNTAAIEDGYVCGLEPATNFPNTRTYEQGQGRVVQLQGGESREFRLDYNFLSGESEIASERAAIEEIRISGAVVNRVPKPGWSDV